MVAAEAAVVGVISLPVLQDFLWWGRLRLSLNPPNPVLARTEVKRQKDLNSLNIGAVLFAIVSCVVGRRQFGTEGWKDGEEGVNLSITQTDKERMNESGGGDCLFDCAFLGFPITVNWIGLF